MGEATLIEIKKSLQGIERQLEHLIGILEEEKKQKAADREQIEKFIILYGEKMNGRGGISAHYLDDILLQKSTKN